MVDDRFAPLSNGKPEQGWRCLAELESPDTMLDESGVVEWAGACLRGLDLPAARLIRVKKAVERALVSFIARVEDARPRRTVHVRVMVPESELPMAAIQQGEAGSGMDEEGEDGLSGRAWGLFVVEKLDGELPADENGPHPVIDVYLYSEGENTV